MRELNPISEAELNEIRAKVYKFVYRADYKWAVRYLKRMNQRFPNTFFILVGLAVLPYEDSFHLPPKLKKRAFRKAASNVRPLLRRLRGVEQGERFHARNEYYWFSEQHKKQYDLGVEGVKALSPRAYYSQGVGASSLAHKMIREGKTKRGLKWAKVAERAWLKYFKLWTSKYHDAWAFYALSLGLQGRNKEMERALKRSAKLAGISYRNNPNLNAFRGMVEECWLGL